MTTEPNEHVEDRLREAFPVDPSAAARLAGRALGTPLRRPGSVRLRTSLALATVAASVALGVWLSRPPTGRPPDAPAHAGVTDLSGFFVDGVLVLPIPDNGIVITGPGHRHDRPADGCGFVFVEGELQ